jgi:protein-tyrosine phosphatase
MSVSAVGLCNIRDLGGLPTEDGRITRSGVLYRSDVPLPGDPEPDGIGVWPPRTVLDLRSPVEIAAVPHPLASGTTVVRPLPLIDDSAHAGAATAVLPSGPEARAWFAGLYHRWLDEHPDRIVAAVTAAVQGPWPVLVHCAAGRDRTGVVTALLLRAAGVERAAVVDDYRRTEDNQERIVARLAATGRRIPVRALAALQTPEAIERVLDTVDEHPGGATGWLVAGGAPPGDLRRWTEHLLS